MDFKKLRVGMVERQAEDTRNCAFAFLIGKHGWRRNLRLPEIAKRNVR